MDLLLNACDDYFFTPYVYPHSVPPDSVLRQFVSLFIILTLGGYFAYLAVACVVYFLFFDKRIMNHPLYIKNQLWLEMAYACKSIPIMGIFTTSIFIFEIRGYSKLYDKVNDCPLGWPGLVLHISAFFFFTDFLIYWIHRGLHHRLFYKAIHKPHHRWKVTTPFASHAFHPIDGFLQSVPYHIYVFLFPFHKITYIVLFLLVNVWTVSIHDGIYKVPKLLEPLINGSAHHTDHHLFYNYNYGQYLTLWDRIGKSYRYPSALKGNGPLTSLKEKEG